MNGRHNETTQHMEVAQKLNPGTLIINLDGTGITATHVHNLIAVMTQLANSGITTKDVSNLVQVLSKLSGTQMLTDLARELLQLAKEPPSREMVPLHVQHPIAYKRFRNSRKSGSGNDEEFLQALFGQLASCALREESSFPLSTSRKYMSRLETEGIVSAADLVNMTDAEFCHIVARAKKLPPPKTVMIALTKVNEWLFKHFELALLSEEKH
jgi:hypothetical protein